MGPEDYLSLTDMVARHARTRPDALAVQRGEHGLSYAELDQRGTELAHLLLDSGVRPGSTVAVHLGRSLEWVIAMVGVLRCGAVCMPLDPAAPVERMTSAVHLAGPAALLTGASPDHPVPPAVTPTFTVAADAPVTGRTADPGVRVRPGDLAYAMHTSGSAGRPKVVLTQHQWLTSDASRGATLNRAAPDDRGSWLGAPGAGIAVHEVAVLLWAGASIHIAEPDVVASPPLLREWLIANRITMAFVITPVGEVLQSLDWPPACALRLMTVGGDKLNRWAPPDLPFEIAVSYGSMEAFQIANSLHPWESRCTPATASDAERAAPPPVGRPLPGVQVHVLEQDLSRTEPGSIGELWISSTSLALGYLGDPAQTADRFRPNPFGEPGSRLYRSGDAGRFRPNGLLEHHGRIDSVVKVRGHRVELGEVEWVLGQHSKVRQACVVAVRDDDGQTQLVACVVGVDDPSPAELRAFVARRVPDFMVPVAYVPMDRLPVNTSNKVDRQALPPADWSRWRPAQPYRAPRGEVEIGLAKLFMELLAVPRVGVDDNFVELGGDSLLAARLRARIEEVFDVRMNLVDLMGAGSLGELAQRLAQRGDDRPAGRLPAIVPDNRHRVGPGPGTGESM